jgi:predicted enzyme related to lactoylglutathione lyase
MATRLLVLWSVPVPSAVRHVTFDCADPYQLATFWSQVLGGSLDPEDEPGDPEAVVQAEGSPTLLFQRVPEGKTVKNRVHLDLQPQGVRRDDEVERLQALGATVVGDHRRPDGTGWVTMADIEGNEFCVERSDLERAASGT